MGDPNQLFSNFNQSSSQPVIVVNNGFTKIGLDPGEFQAVPPQKYTLDYQKRQIIVNNRDDPNDFKNGIYQTNESSAFGKSDRQPWWSAIAMFRGERWIGWHTPWYAGEQWKYLMDGYTQHPYLANELGGKGEYQGGGLKKYYKTYLTDGKTIHGEWAQIKLPYNLKLTRYSIMTSQHCCLGRMPSDFFILGSTDGNAWVILDHQTSKDPADSHDLSNPVEYKIQNPTASFNHFRIAVKRVGGRNGSWNCVVNIAQFNLFGKYCNGLVGPCENFETYNKMPRIEGLTVMESENKLLADLMDFNKKYANYVQCTDTMLNTNGKNAQGQTCSNDDKNINTVNTAYDKLITYTTSGGTNTLTGGDIYSIFNTHVNNGVTNQQYDASFNYIKNTYNNDILKLRGELDAKMKELYVTPDSRMHESKVIYDSTIYAGLLWTILATSGLYFVFTKL
jgi:hypothetical protein